MRGPQRFPHIALIAGLFLSLSLALPTTSVQAMRAPGAVSGHASEITKVTLSDTSPAAPALWTSTTGTVRSVLAWIGSDTAHHLNVMTSAIGTRYFNKVTLPETSGAHPAVARTASSAVAVAWIGTDTAHTLNVLYDVYGASRHKVTLWGETSDFAPAFMEFNNTLALAWTGKDAGRSLNILPLAIPSLTPGIKTTLRQFSGTAGPGLRLDSASTTQPQMLLSWTAVMPVNQLRFATSTNGVTWTAPTTTLPESSGSTPDLIGIGDAHMPAHYLLWTGTDTGRSMNVQYSESFPAWPNPAGTKTILPEAAFGGIVAGFLGGPSQLLVVWTGTDAAHHLNVSIITPTSSPSPCTSYVPTVSPDVIVWGNTNKRQVTVTFDAGGEDGVRATTLLDIMQQQGVHSTWFLESAWALEHSAIIQRVQRDGHELGNHTVDHPNLKTPARSDNYICYELTQNEQIVGDITGSTTRPYFRPPYGEYNDQVRTLAAQLGYRTVYWTIDPRDWDPATTKQDILDRIFNSPNLKPGAIILMHAGSLHEPEALPDVIAGLKARGFAIVTLSQLIAP